MAVVISIVRNYANVSKIVCSSYVTSSELILYIWPSLQESSI